MVTNISSIIITLYFTGRTEQLKRKEWQKCLVLRENFIPPSHKLNYIHIFTFFLHRETIICMQQQAEWNAGKRVLLVIIPNWNWNCRRFFCVSREAIFSIQVLKWSDLSMLLARTYFSQMGNVEPRVFLIWGLGAGDTFYI